MSSAGNDNNPTAIPHPAPETLKELPAAAHRALEEAAARRAAELAAAPPTEYGGRGGADPSRFGDWEINGRAIDF